LHRTKDRILLALIFLITTFSLVVMWPSEPWHYLPASIPWPEGRGINLPFVKIDGATMAGTSLDRREMRLGLDLRGGTRLVLEPDLTGLEDVNRDDALDKAMEIIERRVNTFGVAESEIQRQGDRIAVQLPGITAEEAVSQIGKTALLEWRELQYDGQGNVAILQADGQTVWVPESSLTRDMLQQAAWVPSMAIGRDGLEKPLTGRYLKDTYLTGDAAGNPLLNFELNDEGGHLMGQISSRMVGKPLAFFLDGKPLFDETGQIYAPIIQSPDIKDKGVIEKMSYNEAAYLNKLLNAGAFPVPLKVVQSENVDATLGANSVQKNVIAGEIAMLIIILFMVLHYRLPGLVAGAALFVYTTMVLAVFKLWPITLTLSGIAAFVLSVGMAVDANVLIFERMKEELRSGRSLVVALEEGFHRAWSSIRDSNVSTLITCAILFWFGDQFGASLVKGFALTLALGVIVSMFSAILVTRTFLSIVISIPAARRPVLWAAGVARGGGDGRKAESLPAGDGS